jgi:8-oxo-dGTP diphosphatase
MDEYAYVVNVEGAVVRDGEYLLIERAADEEHAAGILGFPGGKVEQPPGGEETIRETARRELVEEVGIEVGAVEFVTSRTFEADTGARCLNVVTLCEHVAGDPHPRDPEEVAAVHWLSPDRIRAHEDVPAFVESDLDEIEAVRERRTP